MRLALLAPLLAWLLVSMHPAPLRAQARLPGREVSASPYGVLLGFRPTDDPAAIRRRLAQVRQAGVDWVRTDFFWDEIEPAPGRFVWDRYDEIVRAARQEAISLLAILDYSARWASTDSRGRSDKYPPRRVEDYARYVTATVSRYRDEIRYWQVWNEPDHREFWHGSADDYARLLAAAYRAIKAADPAAQVVLGGLAQGGRHDPRFLERLLGRCGGERGCFDIMAFHTNFRPMRQIRAQFARNQRILARFRIERPVWVTEASYTSDPRHQTLTGYRGGEEAHAAYLLDAVRLGMSLGAERIFWAGMYDYEGEAGPYSASGLVRADFRPKAAYFAYRRLVACTRPPPPSGGTGPAPYFATNENQPLVTLTPLAACDATRK